MIQLITLFLGFCVFVAVHMAGAYLAQRRPL